MEAQFGKNRGGEENVEISEDKDAKMETFAGLFAQNDNLDVPRPVPKPPDPNVSRTGR